jgi:hypothetical protein
MQSQRNSQKNAIKKIRFFELLNAFFSSFFILTPPTSSMHNFLSFVPIEQFKLLCNRHFKLYKSSSNSKENIIIFKDFLRGSEIGYEMFNQEFSI